MNNEKTKQKFNGGPAFPIPLEAEDFGMSHRDWLAGQALAGMTANPKLLTDSGEFNVKNFRACYEIADEMLAVRKESK